MDTETCYRCGRRTAFRFFSFRKRIRAKKKWSALERIPFCTWYCAREYALVTGYAVEDDAGKITIPPLSMDPTEMEYSR